MGRGVKLTWTEALSGVNLLSLSEPLRVVYKVQTMLTSSDGAVE